MKPEKLTICGWGPYRELAEIDFDSFRRESARRCTDRLGDYGYEDYPYRRQSPPEAHGRR